MVFKRISMQVLTLALSVCLGACGGGGGGDSTNSGPSTPVTTPSGPTDTAYSDSARYSTAPGDGLGTAVEAAAITHHQLALGGKTIAYTATAGHLTATDPKTGKPEASFFYVAYTADGQDATKRPVTFFYNGGPGSASVWLHLGSFGPKRLVTGDPSASPATPFALVDNAESLLDTTDLLFVDAVGTGLSEAISPNTNQSFWSVDADADVFRDFVSRYLAANQRSASPKFLFGESYGTLRSALLADVLEAAGITVNGVVLQSSILNYNSNCSVFNIGQVSCAGYLPSYAAIGAYYGLTNPAQTDIPAYMQQMRSYAADSYGPAVSAYISPAHTPPPTGMTTQLFNYTGAPLSIWQVNFDLDPGSFQYDLVPNTLIGRYDARVSAPKNSPLTIDGDPSSTVIDAQFISTIRRYLPQSLQYTSATAYAVTSAAISYWSFSHDGQAAPDGIPDLAAALAQNPKMAVLSLNGYHDLATPFYQTELDLARLGTGARLTVKAYNGGHMTYLDDGSRPLEKADIAAFYASVLAQ